MAITRETSRFGKGTKWLNLSSTSGGSGSETSNTTEKHSDIGNVGVRDWLVPNVEPDTDCDFVN